VTPRRGRLVAFEGVDGSGKSTQARILATTIGAVLTFEPGATGLGSALRHLLLDPGHPEPEVRAEALLMAADRAQHVAEVIRPALEEGRAVVTDRFSGSTLAYQGYGRGLPVGELSQLVAWATGGVEPDLTVVVDVPLAVARRRLERGAADRLEKRPADRLEKRSADRLERLDVRFFSRVRDGYLELAGADPLRWSVVDGDADVDSVAAAVRQAVEQRLGDVFDEERS
jgi:dTMP kinase